MLSRKSFEELPVFIASMSRWDGETSSASLALAKVMARTCPVYYIDFPYSYTDFWRERNKTSVVLRRQALLHGKNFLWTPEDLAEKMMIATPRLVLPFYSFPSGSLFNLISHHNNQVVTRLVQKIIREEGIKKYLFLNSFNPSYLSKIRAYLQPEFSIYQSRDVVDQLHQPSIDRENQCVKNYDLTIATSKQICRNLRRRTGRIAHYLPNGGDIDLFRTAVEKRFPRPVELEAITTPIIGYTGAVCQRIDYTLVVKLAKAHPDKTIVFVGPRYDNNYTDMDLDNISNIVFIGAKKLDELPAYLQHFDCTIIPFLCNDLTAGIYPLKINEYLAAGKPVVTSNFSEEIEAFEKCIYLTSSHEDFIGAIDSAIDSDSECKRKERLEASVENSWENRLKAFRELAWAAYQEKSTHLNRQKSQFYAVVK